MTVLQEKFAVSIGYMNWKEFININKDTSEPGWIDVNSLGNIIENIFDKKILDSKDRPFLKIQVLFSKLFLVDVCFLKEIYKTIPDNDFYYIQKTILGESTIENNLIAIEEPIILSKKDNNLNMADSFIRCISGFVNEKSDDYIYISSETILPDLKQTIANGIRMGASVFVFNYVFDETSIWNFMRLLFSGSVLIFSGKDSFKYKETIKQEMETWIKNNNSVS